VRNHHSPNSFRSNTYRTCPQVLILNNLHKTLSLLDATLTKNTGEGLKSSGAAEPEQTCSASFYAETLFGSIRRSGLAPGIGNCMCQKFVSGELNSTPTYCLPSRARWMETTRHSID